MPLIPREGPPTTTVGFSEHDAPEPSFLSTLSASLQNDGMIGSTLSMARTNMQFGDLNQIDASYNPYADPDMKPYLDEDPTRGETIFSKPAADAMRARIDNERKNRETLAASGWIPWLGAQAITQLTDPANLIPVGAFARSGKLGYDVIKSAASVAAGAGLGTAVQELGLQETQVDRSAEESLVNIGGSVLLGSILGGVGSRFLTHAEFRSAGDRLAADLAPDAPDTVGIASDIVSRMQAAGAAAVDDVKLDDLAVGGPRAAQALAQATAALKINPGVETMFSPSKAVRETYQRLVDNPIYTKMQMEGRTLGPDLIRGGSGASPAADVESLVKLYQRGALGDWLDSSRKLYREARKAGYTGKRSDFYSEVSKAGRRGDVDVNGNEFITKAAQEARTKIFDPLLERAKKAGLLPEDVKVTTSASYVTRLWNRQKLIGEEGRFRSIARKYFAEQLAGLPEGKGPDFINDADMRDYIETVITSVFNNLTGRGKGDMPEWIVPVTRGPLKERTFSIPDHLVEDFLDNDMEAILRKYTRTMGAEIELTDKFGRADMREQFEAIAREYDELSAAAKTPAERQKLNLARNRDMTNLTAFRDMIRGTYRAADNASNWSKITRAALTWNYVRLLGGVTLSSLTDASRLVAVHGVRATMREALPALIKNVRAVQISRADAKALGAVTERVLESRLATMTELTDPYAYGSTFERFMSNTSHAFSKATGLGWWNDTLKTMSSVMTQNRMMRNAMYWHGTDKAERAYMAYLGVNEDMAERFAAQFRKHGVEQDGIYGANVADWDDDVAARAWAAALNKDVDRTIITKGVSDTPLWTKTNWGRLIFQFKSFGLASHQRVLLAGLQERPQRFAEMMAMSTALGMMVGYLKYMERGDADEAKRLLENPGLWVTDGLDRSGILSIPFEISNTAEKMGVPGIMAAAQAIAGDKDRGGTASRYASRGVVGALLGPSVGIVEDLKTINEQLINGDLKASGANAIIRQIPGATLPGIRSAVHMGLKPYFVEAVQ